MPAFGRVPQSVQQTDQLCCRKPLESGGNRYRYKLREVDSDRAHATFKIIHAYGRLLTKPKQALHLGRGGQVETPELNQPVLGMPCTIVELGSKRQRQGEGAHSGRARTPKMTPAGIRNSAQRTRRNLKATAEDADGTRSTTPHIPTEAICGARLSYRNCGMG